MFSLDTSCDVHLVPAASPEAQKLLTQTIRSKGLTESKIDDIASQYLNNDKSEPQLDNETTSQAQSSSSVDSPDNPSIKTVKRAKSEFEGLQALTTNQAGVYCWPVRPSSKGQYKISSGDLFLFYIGDHVYQFAAKVNGQAPGDALWEVISPEPTTDTNTIQSIVFSEVVRIQIDSSVIADLAGHDVDYPLNFQRLNESSKNEIKNRFDGLESFIDRARKEGINTTPSKSHTDSLEKWTNTTSESQPTEPSSTSPSSIGNKQSSDAGVNSPIDQTTSSPSGSKDSPQIESPDQTSEGGLADLKTHKDWKILQEHLEKQKLVEIVGPENTGKRKIIDFLIKNWFADGGRVDKSQRVSSTNFHPDINFEEFVLGGYGEPNTEHPGLVTGPLGDFVDLAAADTQQFVSQGDDTPPKYLLIIENFQMANATTVFGDLWQALKPEQRGPENSVRISGAGTKLWVPDEFYIIGLVDSNRTSSQDIPNRDDPLFWTYHTEPDTEPLRTAYDMSQKQENEDIEEDDFGVISVLALEQLNKQIRDSEFLGPEYALGQFYLSARPDKIVQMSEIDLFEAWQYDIFSTLAKYGDDGLAKIGSTLLDGHVPPGDNPLSLGQIHSDIDLVRGIVTSLAQDHKQYSS